MNYNHLDTSALPAEISAVELYAHSMDVTVITTSPADHDIVISLYGDDGKVGAGRVNIPGAVINQAMVVTIALDELTGGLTGLNWRSYLTPTDAGFTAKLLSGDDVASSTEDVVMNYNHIDSSALPAEISAAQLYSGSVDVSITTTAPADYDLVVSLTGANGRVGQGKVNFGDSVINEVATVSIALDELEGGLTGLVWTSYLTPTDGSWSTKLLAGDDQFSSTEDVVMNYNHLDSSALPTEISALELYAGNADVTVTVTSPAAHEIVISLTSPDGRVGQGRVSVPNAIINEAIVVSIELDQLEGGLSDLVWTSYLTPVDGAYADKLLAGEVVLTSTEDVVMNYDHIDVSALPVEIASADLYAHSVDVVATVTSPEEHDIVISLYGADGRVGQGRVNIPYAVINEAITVTIELEEIAGGLSDLYWASYLTPTDGPYSQRLLSGAVLPTSTEDVVMNYNHLDTSAFPAEISSVDLYAHSVDVTVTTTSPGAHDIVVSLYGADGKVGFGRTNIAADVVDHQFVVTVDVDELAGGLSGLTWRAYLTQADQGFANMLLTGDEVATATEDVVMNYNHLDTSTLPAEISADALYLATMDVSVLATSPDAHDIVISLYGAEGRLSQGRTNIPSAVIDEAIVVTMDLPELDGGRSDLYFKAYMTPTGGDYASKLLKGADQASSTEDVVMNYNHIDSSALPAEVSADALYAGSVDVTITTTSPGDYDLVVSLTGSTGRVGQGKHNIASSVINEAIVVSVDLSELEGGLNDLVWTSYLTPTNAGYGEKLLAGDDVASSTENVVMNYNHLDTSALPAEISSVALYAHSIDVTLTTTSPADHDLVVSLKGADGKVGSGRVNIPSAVINEAIVVSIDLDEIAGGVSDLSWSAYVTPANGGFSDRLLRGDSVTASTEDVVMNYNHLDTSALPAEISAVELYAHSADVTLTTTSPAAHDIVVSLYDASGKVGSGRSNIAAGVINEAIVVSIELDELAGGLNDLYWSAYLTPTDGGYSDKLLKGSNVPSSTEDVVMNYNNLDTSTLPGVISEAELYANSVDVDVSVTAPAAHDVVISLYGADGRVGQGKVNIPSAVINAPITVSIDMDEIEGGLSDLYFTAYVTPEGQGWSARLLSGETQSTSTEDVVINYDGIDTVALPALIDQASMDAESIDVVVTVTSPGSVDVVIKLVDHDDIRHGQGKVNIPDAVINQEYTITVEIPHPLENGFDNLQWESYTTPTGYGESSKILSGDIVATATVAAESAQAVNPKLAFAARRNSL
jgi:hypothetical protein